MMPSDKPVVLRVSSNRTGLLNQETPTFPQYLTILHPLQALTVTLSSRADSSTNKKHHEQALIRIGESRTATKGSSDRKTKDPGSNFLVTNNPLPAPWLDRSSKS